MTATCMPSGPSTGSLSGAPAGPTRKPVRRSWPRSARPRAVSATTRSPRWCTPWRSSTRPGQRAAKADIFSRRVIAPRAPRLGADTPADALAISLDTCGQARLSEIARLLGTSEEDARGQLGTLVFDDPESGTLIPAAEYLSGQVRVKLEQARAAAGDDPRFAVNAAELRTVIPADLTPGEIDARLGAAWIGAPYVQQFLRELLDDHSIQVEHPGGQVWAVKGARHSVLATATWGTGRYPAPQLAQAILEQRAITVHDTIQAGDGERTVLNPDATLAAQEKAAEMGERFSEWAWEDPARAAALARIYNDRFNSLVLRNYDGTGSSMPGLALTFRPRPHQVAAVARMVHEPAVLLAHEVGAGQNRRNDHRCDRAAPPAPGP